MFCSSQKITRTECTQLQVLTHHNIKSTDIHGSVKHAQRVKILEDFKKGGSDDARVLLISNVGSVGLNIAFANILIIVVSATCI